MHVVIYIHEIISERLLLGRLSFSCKQANRLQTKLSCMAKLNTESAASLHNTQRVSLSLACCSDFLVFRFTCSNPFVRLYVWNLSQHASFKANYTCTNKSLNRRDLFAVRCCFLSLSQFLLVDCAMFNVLMNMNSSLNHLLWLLSRNPNKSN